MAPATSTRREYLRAEYVRQLRGERLYTEAEIRQRASCYDGDCHGGGRGLRFEDVERRKMNPDWLREQCQGNADRRVGMELGIYADPPRAPREKSLIGRTTT